MDKALVTRVRTKDGQENCTGIVTNKDKTFAHVYWQAMGKDVCTRVHTNDATMTDVHVCARSVQKRATCTCAVRHTVQ